MKVSTSGRMKASSLENPVISAVLSFHSLTFPFTDHKVKKETRCQCKSNYYQQNKHIIFIMDAVISYHRSRCIFSKRDENMSCELEMIVNNIYIHKDPEVVRLIVQLQHKPIVKAKLNLQNWSIGCIYQLS